MICLLITDPYSYERLLERALDAAVREGEALLAVFFFSPREVKRTIEELGEKGWLGSGSLRALEASMLGGYRALAGDVLADVARRAEERGVQVHTQLFEGDRDGLKHLLEGRGCSKVLSDGPMTGLEGSASKEG